MFTRTINIVLVAAEQSKPCCFFQRYYTKHCTQISSRTIGAQWQKWPPYSSRGDKDLISHQGYTPSCYHTIVKHKIRHYGGSIEKRTSSLPCLVEREVCLLYWEAGRRVLSTLAPCQISLSPCCCLSQAVIYTGSSAQDQLSNLSLRKNQSNTAGADTGLNWSGK